VNKLKDQLWDIAAQYGHAANSVPEDTDAPETDNGKVREHIRQARKLDSQLLAETGGSTGPEPYFQLDSLDTIMALPPKTWWIKQVLGKGDTVMVYGESKAGKTMVVFNMMLALARGEGYFAGLHEICAPANVLYMTAEGRSGLAQRVRGAVASIGMTEEAMARCKIIRKVVQFLLPEQPSYYERFIDEVVAQGFTPDVVFIDHLSSTVPGKGDSDQGAATLVAQAVSEIQDQLGCAMVLIHHTGYDKSHSRGMTNYTDILDMQIKVSNTSNPRTMSCGKNKDGPEWKDRAFNIVPVDGTDGWSIEWLGRAETPEEIQKIYDGLVELVRAEPGLTRTQLSNKAIMALGLGRNESWQYVDTAANETNEHYCIRRVADGGSGSSHHYFAL